MATATEGDQVFLRVLTHMASELLMMDFEIGHRSAKLASPTVPLQDRKTELVILLRPKSGYLSDAIRLHAAVSLTSAMNLAC